MLVLAITATIVGIATAESEYICLGDDQRVGDCNNDGAIDEIDRDILLAVWQGTIGIGGQDICCGDVDEDGNIGMFDVLAVSNFISYQPGCFIRGYSCSQKEHCSDGIDNDCDGLIDCDDSDCAGDPACMEYICLGDDQRVGDCNNDGAIDEIDRDILLAVWQGTIGIGGQDICCGDVDEDGNIGMFDVLAVSNFISYQPGCFIRGYSCSQKEHCFDGIDNDCDGLIDGQDPDC